MVNVEPHYTTAGSCTLDNWFIRLACLPHNGACSNLKFTAEASCWVLRSQPAGLFLREVQSGLESRQEAWRCTFSACIVTGLASNSLSLYLHNQLICIFSGYVSDACLLRDGYCPRNHRRAWAGRRYQMSHGPDKSAACLDHAAFFRIPFENTKNTYRPGATTITACSLASCRAAVIALYSLLGPTFKTCPFFCSALSIS